MRGASWWALVALVVPAVGPSDAPAQVADNPRVQEAVEAVRVWLDAQQAYERIPGMSAAIVHDQEVVWSGAFGSSHPDRNTPAATNTLYSICSISKLFTSIAVMQLRDRGLVELDAPVEAYLPWYQVRQQYEGSAPVTVQGLLTHASGLPRESDHPYWSAPDFPFPTREEIIAGLRNQETLYPAWRTFQYSNLGLSLAGEIVREVSGVPYDEYVRQNILTPLGMRDTYPEMPEQHRGGQLADGYGSLTRSGVREPVPFFQGKGIAPAAGFASTAEDLARFAAWQFRLDGAEEEVLRAHTLAEMHRVHYVDPEWNTFWGLGFSVSRRGDKTFVGHGGSCPGYRTQLALQKDDQVATVFLANAMVNTATYVYGIYDLVAEAVRDAAKKSDGPEGGEPPGPSKAAAGPDLGPFLGTYSGQPWGGETAAIRWKGGLALMSLPSETPLRAITRLRHVEGDTFRRIRSDDDLGEAVVFERDGSGRVTGFRQHGNLSPRTR
jgi:CubicO group peptidase (beta-lactamase class C family)